VIVSVIAEVSRMVTPDTDRAAMAAVMVAIGIAITITSTDQAGFFVRVAEYPEG
jgi:hypothetical protein